MSQQNTDKQQASSLVLAAIAKALKPIVRLLLHYGIGYPQLIALLKHLYVDVAEEELNTPIKRISDSRITLLTGVHRKDVARLRNVSLEEQGELTKNFLGDASSDSTASLGARLVAEWLANPRFLEGRLDGNPPAPLAIRATENGDHPDFQELVEKICKKDMRARSVLDEWLRLGIVSITGEHVTLNTEAFAPTKGLDEKAYFFGRNIQDHVEAGASNLRGTAAPFFDRSVFYDRLSLQSIDELTALSKKGASALLTQINSRAHSLQERDNPPALASGSSPELASGRAPDASNKAKSQEHFRFNLGIFNYHTASEQQAETSSDD